MIESATTPRAARTAHAIHHSALALTDEHGFDGWTMEQLAEAVGVSRRTLFNHVASKMAAILGPEKQPDPDHIATFVAGGPTGQLVADLRALALTMLEDRPADRAELARVRRVLRSDPRVMHAAHARFEEGTARFAEVIRQREGAAFPMARAQLAVRVMVVVFEMALDDYLDHPHGSLADAFTRTFDALVDLLR
ncbi:TetR family transcriptional regulator [Nocardioides sp. DS6]|uniref:TetR family transcriptional regulator n=1 Tax=Nocardioides eburneus TaxID=3231482 RepID=A0ABV3T032_9ACTN